MQKFDGLRENKRERNEETGMGKRLRESRIKRNIPICVAAVLLCLTLFSAYLVTSLFARYTTSAQSSDQARVAKFSIKGGDKFSTPITADLIPGEYKKVYLDIKNDSEVAVEYTLEVTNETQNLPLSFRMVKDDGSSELPDVHTSGDYITYTEQKLPGSHTDEYMLVIDWLASEDEDRDPNMIGMVDHIKVTVTAAQTD